MLQWARQRNHVLPFTVAAGGTWIALTIAPQLHWSMAVVVLLATIFLVYLELLTQWSFRAPTKRKPALELTGWKRLDITVEGYRLAHYLKAGEPNKPVAWLCHGWTSGAIRMGTGPSRLWTGAGTWFCGICQVTAHPIDCRSGAQSKQRPS